VDDFDVTGRSATDSGSVSAAPRRMTPTTTRAPTCCAEMIAAS